MSELQPGRGGFGTTRWTLIRALSGSADERAAAMAALCAAYREPVRAYLVWRGLGQEADEITQDFFARVVLTRDLFGSADPARGRLRALLLTALRRFLIDRARRDRARPDGRALPVHEGLDGAPVCDEAAAVFDREWARAVVAEAVRRAREHYAAAGRGAHWRLYESWELEGRAGGGEPPAMGVLARELGIRDEHAAYASLQNTRRFVASRLREVLAESLGEGADWRREKAELEAALRPV